VAVVTEIAARGFRNLASTRWSLDRGGQLVLGPNGAGKTSLLEAVYVLATTRSFRTHRLALCVEHAVERFDLVGEVVGESRTRLEVGWGAASSRPTDSLTPTDKPRSRATGTLRRTLNGSSVSTAEYLSVLPVVAWSSKAGDVVSGPPEARRRFLDQGLVAQRPRLFETLSRYRQALAQKRTLLREGRASELETWNGVLAPLMVEIGRERARHAAELGEATRELVERSTDELGGRDIQLGLRYRPSLRFDGEPTEDEVFARLEGKRREEVERRSPLLGPHRDDLEIDWRGYPAAAVTSAGERKLLGLSLYAARGRLLEASGRKPVYLLDDLDTELDEDRLRLVWGLFSSSSQRLVTSNRPDVWSRIGIDRIWTLEAGRPPSEHTC